MTLTFFNLLLFVCFQKTRSFLMIMYSQPKCYKNVISFWRYYIWRRVMSLCLSLMLFILITQFRCCCIFLLYNHWFPFPSSLIMWKGNVNILLFIKKVLLDLSVISDSCLIIFTYHEECKWSGRGRDWIRRGIRNFLE